MSEVVYSFGSAEYDELSVINDLDVGGNVAIVGDLDVGGTTTEVDEILAGDLTLGSVTTQGGVFRSYYDGAGTVGLYYNSAVGLLELNVQGSGGGLEIGGDVHLYRGASNTLYLGQNDGILFDRSSDASVTYLTFSDETASKFIIGMYNAAGGDAFRINNTGVGDSLLINQATMAASFGGDVSLANDLVFNSQGAILSTKDEDGAEIIVQARDTGNALQTVMIIQGSSVPYVSLGGTGVYKFYQDDTATMGATISALDAAGYALLNEAASNVNPTLIPNQADTDTGIGWNIGDRVVLIAGGSPVAYFSKVASGMRTTLLTGGTITSSSTDDMAIDISATLNDTGAAGGSDLFNLIKGNITETDITGWNTVNLMDLQVGGTSKFTVTRTGSVTLSGTNPTFVYDTDLANADARNWGIATNINSFGDYVIKVSNAKDGDPFAAGSTAFQLLNDKSAVFGAGATFAGDVLVSGSGSTNLTVRSNTSNAVLILDNGDDGTPETSYIRFQSNQVDKWQLESGPTDLLGIYDWTNTQYVLSMNPAAATVVATWSNITHTGFVASGQMDLNAGADIEGAVTIEQFLTMESTGGSGLRVYGGSGTNQWDVYLSGANLRLSDNTGGGVFDIDTGVNIDGLLDANAGADIEGAVTVTHSVGPVGLFERTTTGTNSFFNTLSLLAQSSNDMTDGFGPQIQFKIGDTGVATPGNPIAGIYGFRDGDDASGGLKFLVDASDQLALTLNADKSAVFGAGATLAGTLAMGGFNIENIAILDGRSDGIFYIDVNLPFASQGNGLIIRSKNASDVDTARATLTSGFDTVTLTWANVTHTGFTASGLLTASAGISMGSNIDMNGTNLLDLNRIESRTNAVFVIQSKYQGVVGNAISVQTTGVGAGYVDTERLQIGSGAATVVATWSNITHTGLVVTDTNGIFTGVNDDDYYALSAWDKDLGAYVDLLHVVGGINVPYLEVQSGLSLQFRNEFSEIYSSSSGVLQINALTQVYHETPLMSVYASASDATLLVRSNTDDAVLTLDSGDDGTPEESQLIFADDRAGKWMIYKPADNSFRMRDTVSSTDFVTFTTGTPVTATWASVVHTGFVASGDINPNADGTIDLGTQTTAQWANVWSDLINGAEFTMMNKWRIMESDLYDDYPEGFAVGHSLLWKDGVSIWHSENRSQYMAGLKPVFAVTDEFLEFKGHRWVPQDYIHKDEVDAIVQKKVDERLAELGVI